MYGVFLNSRLDQQTVYLRRSRSDAVCFIMEDWRTGAKTRAYCQAVDLIGFTAYTQDELWLNDQDGTSVRLRRTENMVEFKSLRVLDQVIQMPMINLSAALERARQVVATA